MSAEPRPGSCNIRYWRALRLFDSEMRAYDLVVAQCPAQLGGVRGQLGRAHLGERLRWLGELRSSPRSAASRARRLGRPAIRSRTLRGLPDGRHAGRSDPSANGADVKIVQARLRHGSAKTTLDTYGHLWPDKDESTMAIVDSVFKARFEGPADSSRTAGGAP
jgi:integrase